MNFSEIIDQVSGHLTAELIIYLTGLAILAYWMIKTAFGTKSLAGSPPRRNDMPAYLPFIVLLFWFGIISIVVTVTRGIFGDLQDWQNALLDNIILCLGALITMVLIIFLVRRHFAGRLKGFGLNTKTIVKDLANAVLNLLGIWPLVSIALILTLYLGRFFCGPDFQLQQHQELTTLTLHSQLSLRILVIITAVVIVPVFEEMLFRGMFQTTIRSYVDKPWIAILATAFIFAMVHFNKEHWPALFVLGLCLGYAYEKSGSLFRPVFIHSFFNAASIIIVLNQS